MLILTRKKGQCIYIDGKKIEIFVVDIDTKSKIVHIGVKAPKEIGVLREEIYERYQPNERS